MTRKTATSWKKGQSGNPAGKPKGTKNRATMLALAAMEGELDAIVKSVIDAAKKGDMAAARLVVDKLIPVAKDRPVNISLPDITNISECANAQATIVAAVATGELLPSEGEALSGLVDYQRRSVESVSIEARLQAIEEKLGVKG